jgi:hypothetical protein
MPQPRLIHPIAISIEVLERSQTLVDEDYREPVSYAARGNVVVVNGQLHWTIDDRLRQTLVGPEREATGYVTFRTLDLRTAGVGSLQQGDRFTTFGKGARAMDVDCYVVGLRLQGHWPDQGGATLVKAFFRDHSPTKREPTGTT